MLNGVRDHQQNGRRPSISISHASTAVAYVALDIKPVQETPKKNPPDQDFVPPRSAPQLIPQRSTGLYRAKKQRPTPPRSEGRVINPRRYRTMGAGAFSTG